QRFQQISQIYHATRECEPEQRADFLQQACGGDRDLRQEVESLLASEKSAEAFFSSKGMKEKAKRLGGKPSQSLVGRTIDNYQVRSLLGVGGMGEVYRARDTKLGREVAIKVLPAGFASGSDRLRLEREARAVSALNHPNILTIYEIKGADEHLFIATEFVDGENLAVITLAVIALALYKFVGRKQPQVVLPAAKVVPFTTFPGRELQLTSVVAGEAHDLWRDHPGELYLVEEH